MIQGTFLFIIIDEGPPHNVHLFDSNAGSGSIALPTNIRAVPGITWAQGIMNIRTAIYVFITGLGLTNFIGLDYTRVSTSALLWNTPAPQGAGRA
jgi:hypothetical protein